VLRISDLKFGFVLDCRAAGLYLALYGSWRDVQERLLLFANNFASIAYEIASPFGRGSFSGKPKASADPAHSRLRLAVKRR
jgi:hypothetical protein